MNSSVPPKIIYIIVLAEAALACIGLTSLCFTMFYKSYSDPAVLTAIISLTSGIVGSLSTILVSPRSGGDGKPVQTEVTNKPNNPIPVEETKTP